MLTTSQAAKRLKCSRATVIRAAERAGIEQIAGRYLLTDEQIKAMKPLIQKKSGNPNFVKGNHFGQAPKESGK